MLHVKAVGRTGILDFSKNICSLLVLIVVLFLTALEQNLDVEVVVDEDVINSLLKTMRTYSENEELLSLVCTLLMMISISGGSPCPFR